MLRALLDLVVPRTHVAFPCPTSLDVSVARLKAAVAQSNLGVWSEPRLVGSVTPDYVVLTRQAVLGSNGYRIQFLGRFNVETGNTVLSGMYTAPWTTGTIMTAALITTAGWTLHSLWRALTADDAGFREPLLGATVVASVLILAKVAQRLAKRDEIWLSNQIRDALNTAHSLQPRAYPSRPADETSSNRRRF